MQREWSSLFQSERWLGVAISQRAEPVLRSRCKSATEWCSCTSHMVAPDTPGGCSLAPSSHSAGTTGSHEGQSCSVLGRPIMWSQVRKRSHACNQFLVGFHSLVWSSCSATSCVRMVWHVSMKCATPAAGIATHVCHVCACAYFFHKRVRVGYAMTASRNPCIMGCRGVHARIWKKWNASPGAVCMSSSVEESCGVLCGEGHGGPGMEQEWKSNCVAIRTNGTWPLWIAECDRSASRRIWDMASVVGTGKCGSMSPACRNECRWSRSRCRGGSAVNDSRSSFSHKGVSSGSEDDADMGLCTGEAGGDGMPKRFRRRRAHAALEGGFGFGIIGVNR